MADRLAEEDGVVCILLEVPGFLEIAAEETTEVELPIRGGSAAGVLLQLSWLTYAVESIELGSELSGGELVVVFEASLVDELEVSFAVVAPGAVPAEYV